MSVRLLLFLCCLPACSLFGRDDTGDGACARTPPLSWDNFGDGFMTKHCTGCHASLLPEASREGAPLTVNLDTYADVLQWADRVQARAGGAGDSGGADMPPGGGPSDDERARLEEWLTCGVAADAAAAAGDGAAARTRNP